MSPKERGEITTCSGCNRAVYVTDVDARGRCCFCGDEPTPAFEPVVEAVVAERPEDEIV